MTRWLVAICVVVAARIAAADPEADADRAFREASARAAAGDESAIDAFERLGAAAPPTRWSDDAWSEAARLSERARDLPRARRAYERVIAIGGDAALVRRAKAALARIAAATGGGAWDAIAREHERLVGDAFDGGDPRDALEQLEALVRANPGYPRATSVWLVLAQAWEREGDADRALALLEDALAKSDEQRLRIALVRVATRRGELAIAEAELARVSDRAVAGELRERLDIARGRAWIRRALWLVLALAALGAAVLARHAAGSWRAAGRAFAKPPVEALFLLPVGAVLVIVAQTGNPLVAKALLGITIAGIAVAWISGALFELQRAKGLTRGRVIVQAVLAVGVIAAAAYLAVDRDRMLDLVEETLEHGPIPR